MKNKFQDFLNQGLRDTAFHKKQEKKKETMFDNMAYHEWREYFHSKYNYINLKEKKNG